MVNTDFYVIMHSSSVHAFLCVGIAAYIAALFLWYGIYEHLVHHRFYKISFFPSLTLLLCGLVFSTIDSDGNPFYQWVVPMFSIYVLKIWIGGDIITIDKKLSACVWGLVVVSLIISLHYFIVVSNPKFVGSKSDETASRKIDILRYNAMISELKKHVDDETVYRQGYLGINTSHPIQRKYNWLSFKSASYHVVPEWHTIFTGIYYCDYMPQGMWYPGGKISEAISKIELRSAREMEKNGAMMR